MEERILIQILLVVAIIACVLLIANLIRLYQILSDFSIAAASIKQAANTISKTLASWKESAKYIAEFAGEISKYFNAFKKLRNDKE